jgi:hypothetical protein
MKTLLPAVAAALAVAAPALGAYPGTYAQQGAVGPLRVDTYGDFTRIAGHGRSVTVDGQYGIPTLVPAGTRLGLFHDGSRVVLQSTFDQKRTTFLVVRTRDLSTARRVTLRGSFAFDALSPSGRRLYLIQHTSGDFEHYVVRGYDLRAGRLLPGRIADKAQAGWVMRGWPVARVSTTSGRWVYTLYSNPGGFPFVHALDTVAGVAHCVGIAWSGNQDALSGYRLRLRGSRLLVVQPDGKVYRAIDRTTWAVSQR